MNAFVLSLAILMTTILEWWDYFSSKPYLFFVYVDTYLFIEQDAMQCTFSQIENTSFVWYNILYYIQLLR
jgi:hypothetical protein